MTTIKLKNGSGAPTAGDLVQGEPALDLTNKRLYTEDSGGTVIEVGTNPTSITTGDITATGTATFAGLGTTGDVTFGDNDKAIFGAGSDLQIYHNGSNSFIQDVGTGNLYITTNGSEIRLAPYGANENGIRVLQDGAVFAYYDNSAKLATTSSGIDVTGTVVSDGLTVDGNGELKQTSSGGEVKPLRVTNSTTTTGSSASLVFNLSTVSSDNAKIEAKRTNSPISSDTELNFYQLSNGTMTLRQKIATNGDISFYNDAGTSQDLYWDASTSRLGLGTTSPQKPLVISNAGANGIEIEPDSASGNRIFSFNRSTTAYTPLLLDGDSLRFRTGSTATERMRIDSSGNVGIGTTSPAFSAGSGLRIERDATATLRLQDTGAHGFEIRATASAGEFFSANSKPFTFITGGSERMRIDSSGNVGIGTDSPSDIVQVKSTSNGDGLTLQRSSLTSGDYAQLGFLATTNDAGTPNIWIRGNRGATFETSYMTFGTGASVGSERMRIGSGGDVRIGKTSSGIGTVGHEFGPTGYTYHTRDGGTVLDLNRLTSDGKIVKFYKDGTEVGSISVTGSATTYNTSSDQRLKDNIVDAPSASDDIDAIQVRSFDWKADGSHQKYGMVAQELQTVAPDAVTGDADSDEMMGVDYSKLVPMLVKEIQSLRARVAQLEEAN